MPIESIVINASPLIILFKASLEDILPKFSLRCFCLSNTKSLSADIIAANRIMIEGIYEIRVKDITYTHNA
jgi:hypothetical protein